VQYLNDHTRWMGAVEILRKQYLARLREAVAIATTFV
jgi:Leu/Phe-tRNA-protein transferase